MENGDNLGEDSVLFPIRQWSIFKAGPYWKHFPYISMCLPGNNHNRSLLIQTLRQGKVKALKLALKKEATMLSYMDASIHLYELPATKNMCSNGWQGI